MKAWIQTYQSLSPVSRRVFTWCWLAGEYLIVAALIAAMAAGRFANYYVCVQWAGDLAQCGLGMMMVSLVSLFVFESGIRQFGSSKDS